MVEARKNVRVGLARHLTQAPAPHDTLLQLPATGQTINGLAFTRLCSRRLAKADNAFLRREQRLLILVCDGNASFWQ